MRADRRVVVKRDLPASGSFGGGGEADFDFAGLFPLDRPAFAVVSFDFEVTGIGPRQVQAECFQRLRTEIGDRQRSHFRGLADFLLAEVDTPAGWARFGFEHFGAVQEAMFGAAVTAGDQNSAMRERGRRGQLARS